MWKTIPLVRTLPVSKNFTSHVQSTPNLVPILVCAVGRAMARHGKEFSEPHQVHSSKVAACSLLHIVHSLFILHLLHYMMSNTLPFSVVNSKYFWHIDKRIGFYDSRIWESWIYFNFGGEFLIKVLKASMIRLWRQFRSGCKISNNKSCILWYLHLQ